MLALKEKKLKDRYFLSHDYLLVQFNDTINNPRLMIESNSFPQFTFSTKEHNIKK